MNTERLRSAVATYALALAAAASGLLSCTDDPGTEAERERTGEDRSPHVSEPTATGGTTETTATTWIPPDIPDNPNPMWEDDGIYVLDPEGKPLDRALHATITKHICTAWPVQRFPVRVVLRVVASPPPEHTYFGMIEGGTRPGVMTGVAVNVPEATVDALYLDLLARYPEVHPDDPDIEFEIRAVRLDVTDEVCAAAGYAPPARLPWE